MKLSERLMRLETRARKAAARGDRRHHEIDEMLQANDQIRAQLVAVFNARLDQIEQNTGRIDVIETQLAEHVADKKAHK